jgi:hypothetical protein
MSPGDAPPPDPGRRLHGVTCLGGQAFSLRQLLPAMLLLAVVLPC